MGRSQSRSRRTPKSPLHQDARAGEGPARARRGSGACRRRASRDYRPGSAQAAGEDPRRPWRGPVASSRGGRRRIAPDSSGRLGPVPVSRRDRRPRMELVSMALADTASDRDRRPRACPRMRTPRPLRHVADVETARTSAVNQDRIARRRVTSISLQILAGASRTSRGGDPRKVTWTAVRLSVLRTPRSPRGKTYAFTWSGCG